jgi:hypothetical protein
MKKLSLVLILSAITLTCSVEAQPGFTGGPSFGGSMAKLFGGNSAFSADVEIQVNGAGKEVMSVPGKLAFDGGKSRFETDMTAIKGGQMSPGAAAEMKSFGMARAVVISRPDTKVTYQVFPDLSAYTQTMLQDPQAAKPESAFKVETTELGKETVNGHPAVKNKVVVTDDQGHKFEATVWNATDLKKFPAKIESDESGGHTTTMLFTNVKLTKPDAALFEPPADYKKYENLGLLMQQVIGGQMKSKEKTNQATVIQ